MVKILRQFYNNRHEKLIKRDNERFKSKKEIYENWRISIIRDVFSQLNLFPGDTYLDVGVGYSGYTVIEIAKKGIDSVGLDISSPAMKNARKRSKESIPKNGGLSHFCISSASDLPFRDAAFSGITSISVLEHIIDENKAISDLSHISKEKGILYISVPNAYSRMLPFFRPHERNNDISAGHLRRYKAECLINHFIKTNFYPLEICYSANIFKHLQYVFHSLVPKIRLNTSRLWWILEDMDISFFKKSSTGVRMNITFIKTKKKI